jgi:hypothetical protein
MKTPFLSDPGKKRQKTGTGGKTATSPVVCGQPDIPITA